MDFRGLETLETYNFILKYADFTRNETRIVSWEQSENPFTITNIEATTTNITQTKNDGEIIPSWATTYNSFKGYYNIVIHFTNIHFHAYEFA